MVRLRHLGAVLDVLLASVLDSPGHRLSREVFHIRGAAPAAAGGGGGAAPAAAGGGGGGAPEAPGGGAGDSVSNAFATLWSLRS